MTQIEQILLNRVKLIEDDSWSLIGSPNSLIKELEALIATQIKEAYQKGFIDGGISTLTQDTKGKPMTNYNERLDEILDKFFEVPYPDYNMGILPDEDGYDAVQERRNYEESYARDEAKQAITSLVKELVAGAQMTHQKYRERLEEIYPLCNRTKPDPKNPRKCYYCGEFLRDFSHTGKQAIDRLFLDVVGENEPTPQSIFDYGDDDQRKYWFNKLRQQLRTTITGKEGGE